MKVRFHLWWTAWNNFGTLNRKKIEEIEQFQQFCPLYHNPCSHDLCQYFLRLTPQLKLSLASITFTITVCVPSCFFCFLLLQFHQPNCQSCICSIIQNYIFLSSSDKEKPQPTAAAETASTWDWAVKLECQTGINLAGYVHINMLIIGSMGRHVVCGTPVTLKRTQCKGTRVCTEKYACATIP